MSRACSISAAKSKIRRLGEAYWPVYGDAASRWTIPMTSQYKLGRLFEAADDDLTWRYGDDDHHAA